MSSLLRVPILLALVLGLGCSRSDEADGAANLPAGAPTPARAIPEVWSDVLKQRDRIHAAIAQEEMWHEDCAEVAAAAKQIDQLLPEFVQSARATASVDAGRQNGIAEVVNALAVVLSGLRENAMQEVPGALPALLPALDKTLRGIEMYLKPEELGSESVVTHPGFNPVENPPPPPI